MTVQTTQPASEVALAVRQDPPQRATGLSLWVEAAQEAQTLARALVQSFFVPQAYKVNIPPRASREEVDAALEVAVANATGAILLGQSLSTPAFEIDPLTALQNIYVVHGRPGMYAKFKVGLAQAHGHRITDIEYSPESCTVEGQRKGTDQVVRITVTMDDAKRAGWTSNKKYSETPADMLWARAASRVVDRIASDALFGIASLEELETDEPAAAAPARVTIDDVRGTAPVPEQQALTGTVTSNPIRATVTAAPAASAPAEPAPPELVDEGTWNAINAAFVRLGVTGAGVRQRRETAIRRIIDRPETPAEAGTSPRTWLTQHDATLVVGTLQGTDRDGIAVLLGEQRREEDEPGDVDLGDADPDGDSDFVPEPDDAERAAEAPQGEEPAGWR